MKGKILKTNFPRFLQAITNQVFRQLTWSYLGVFVGFHAGKKRRVGQNQTISWPRSVDFCKKGNYYITFKDNLKATKGIEFWKVVDKVNS